MYGKILYDVEGNILATTMGKLINVYRPCMDEEFENGRLRLFRNSTHLNICYRYFITSEDQRRRFLEDRQFGTKEGPNKSYHVYLDEDVDRTTKEYQQNFRVSREINM
jgi:hypothetical protein